MTLNRLPLEIELVIASEPKFWSLDPNIIEDRGRLIVWAISVGKMEIFISGADKEHLLSESSLTYGIHDMYLTNLAVYLHDVRDDLKEAFDLSVKNENQLYGGWFDVYGIKSENIHVADSDENKRFGIKAKAKRDLSEGVNLIGLPKAELGIGEDIRMMVQSCLKAGVPFDLYEYPKTPLLSRQADRSIVDHINNKQSKKINIFCLPAFETIRSYTDLKGPVFDGYYNIGYWPWELPYWPDKWLCALDIVDEIWCSTNFIADSLRKLTKKPVMVMPMAVELQYENIYQTITRKSLGLKEDSYTFLNVFDGLSFPSRKNVMAVLKSFVKAFPQDSEESVQLLIKTMNLYKLDSQIVDDVSEIISNDDRIILFDETVDKSNLIQLYSVCDAYISLHRSEGFGRTIAEAMLLNKPVIVSNFSGNTDFCNENNSYLVTGKEIKVGIDEYHFTDNRQYWFDVDYDDAANKLLECYKDQSGSLERSYQAKKNIENNYNADVIGQNYRKRLVEIVGLNFDTVADVSYIGSQDYKIKSKYISNVFSVAKKQSCAEQKRATAVNVDDVSNKVIAFYLPQFHPIKENNEWWGEGFTEWTNVTKAAPQFLGQYQPHLPSDLGFYDLRLTEIMLQQIDLAQHYGIHGFCFYYYWFSGRRILEKPLSNYINDKAINFPFCVCWANENWTRRWDGLDNDVLLSQQHSFEGDSKFIEDVFEIISHPSYIKVDGKPFLLIYRPAVIPQINSLVEVWREYCRKNGLGEIMLGMIQAFNEFDPTIYGFDVAVEFPPHNGYFDLEPINNTLEIMNLDYQGTVVDYRDAIEQSTISPSLKHDYPWIRGCFPSWDNEARKPGAGYSFINNDREGFKKWFKQCVDYSEENPVGGDSFVFVNAWNEWAEGAHLEPDRKNGHMFLNVIAEVIESSK